MSEYRVLARKYRPQRLNDLIGQEVLVRTLTNAINSGRIAHAFLLTGIRGIGKTTTARIIARSLNCLGADGTLNKPTPEPCGACANCTQIAEDRHVDVIEMDAASRTGVGDIRDIIETVHYKPTNARYKVYIIDEVHMLSQQAFNALLKTLEEPPPHVIFVFATTETRKIPVTILSRCQRFDLKRVGIERLAQHLSTICTKENVSAEEEALKLIAIAAEGSVRDSLSLLDQAIAHSADETNIDIKTETVRGMLGVADRSRLFTLLEYAFGGETVNAIELLETHYRDGGDIILLLQDLLALVHVVSRVTLSPKDDLGPSFSEHEKKSATELAGKLDIPSLGLAWQLLLKGLDEAKRAPDPLTAAEMVMIRLSHAASLPRPADLIRQAEKESSMPSTPSPVSPAPSRISTSSPVSSGTSALKMETAPAPGLEPVMMATEPVKLELVANNPLLELRRFEELLRLLEQKREPTLMHHLVQHISLISFEDGALTFTQHPSLPANFTRDLGQFLKRHTGKDWKISPSTEQGAATIAEQRKADYENARNAAGEHPLIKAVMDLFPGSTMIGFEKE